MRILPIEISLEVFFNKNSICTLFQPRLMPVFRSSSLSSRPPLSKLSISRFVLYRTDSGAEKPTTTRFVFRMKLGWQLVSASMWMRGRLIIQCKAKSQLTLGERVIIFAVSARSEGPRRKRKWTTVIMRSLR
jgi:hypothetical protein